MEKRPKKLLDQVREAIRRKHYSIRTEKTYVSWIKRYILFHHKRHPNEMGSTEACPEPVKGSRPSSPTWLSNKTSPLLRKTPALSEAEGMGTGCTGQPNWDATRRNRAG